jgi:hypothetical protein
MCECTISSFDIDAGIDAVEVFEALPDEDEEAPIGNESFR